MNSSFGTIAARRRLLHFRPFLVSEPAANQPSTSRSEEPEISNTTSWAKLKQPDNQKPATRTNGKLKDRTKQFGWLRAPATISRFLRAAPGRDAPGGNNCATGGLKIKTLSMKCPDEQRDIYSVKAKKAQMEG